MTKEILLFSGGLDSFIAWYYLNKPECLYINAKHRYAEKELKAVTKLSEVTGMKLYIDNSLDLSKWEKPDAEIPLRNLLFAEIASLYGADKIWLITQKGETENPSNDRSPEFCKRASNILSVQHGKEITVDSPFWHLTKQQMVKWYLEQNVPISFLYETVSCFSDLTQELNTHCGECSSCFRKWIALAYNNLWNENVNLFLEDPKKWEGIKSYKEKLKIGRYEPQRTKETIEVLKRWNLW